MRDFEEPFRANAAVSSGITSQLPPRNRNISGRVIVVDDEEFIRDLYRNVFESRGFTVFSAPNGEEAVKLLRTMKFKPDAVIMDHRMPGKDGIETTKELLKIDPWVPVIFSSADESVREKALEAGAVSFWSKPFPVSLLVDAMVDMMRAKRRHPSE
jgi:CheY-like chemotaxis protein